MSFNPSWTAYKTGVALSQFLGAADPIGAADTAAGAGGYVYLDTNYTLTGNKTLTANWLGFGGVITLGTHTLTGNFWTEPNIQMFNVNSTGTVSLLGMTTVSIGWFGASSTTADCSGPINAALATGLNVMVPTSGPYVCTSAPLVMATSYQTLFGYGELSQIKFQFAALQDHGIQTTNSNGNQVIRGVFFFGVSNCTKVISIASPQVTLDGCRFTQSLNSGHLIYGEDENSGSNIFVFGLSVQNCYLNGNSTAGGIGIRFGFNSQTARVVDNIILNCGTGVAIQNACDNMVIESNVIENHVTYGVDMDRLSSAPLMTNVSICKNHFEQVPVAVHLGAAEFHSLDISNNFAYRNGTITGSSFFWSDNTNTASAASNNIFISNNFCQSYNTIFQLDNPYSSRICGAKGNDGTGNNNYTAGTYANNAYDVVTANPFYIQHIDSGSLLTNTNIRLEASTCVLEMPIFWGSHQYLDFIEFNTILISGTSITVELHSIQAQGNTDSVVATVSPNASGVWKLNLQGYGNNSLQYYIKVTWSGTDMYIYPFQLFFRE